MADQATNKLSTAEQKNLILGIVSSFVDDDGSKNSVDEFFKYLEHIDFDVTAIKDVKELPNALLGHYRIVKGKYDTDRAGNDLATYGPIAARIRELHQEQKSLAK